MKYQELTIADYNQILASTNPTPGGGNFAAIQAALAIALMKKSIAITNKKESNQQLADFYNYLSKIDDTYQIAENDSAAFQLYLDAWRHKDLANLKQAEKQLSATLISLHLLALDIINRAFPLVKLIKKTIVSDYLAALSSLLSCAEIVLIIKSFNQQFVAKEEMEIIAKWRSALEGEIKKCA